MYRLLIPIVFMFSNLVLANDTITNKIYSEKGLAGEQQVTQIGENKYQGELKISWNNRVYQVSEQVTVNKNNNPIDYQSTGTSAFGAPIKESFKLEDGIATWSSNKEQGQIKSNGEHFFLPVNGSVTDGIMVKNLLNSMTNSVDLLPAGTARIKKLKTVSVSNDGNSAQVHLYAISGLGFNPTFGWYDDDANFFAQDFGGFFRVIRDGYSLENFDQLKTLQKQAEQDYLEEIASRLSHSYSKLLIKNVNLIDVNKGTEQPNSDVLLVNGKISNVGKNLKTKKSTPVIDGTGKSLLPGLWDMHAHLSKNDGILNIAAGVTSARDIGNNHDNIMELEQLFNNNKIIGNNIYRAGFIDQMSEYSAGLSVESLSEAHEKIDWFADNGYLQVKLYSSIDPSWVKPIAEHAHRRGMRLSGHIPAFMTAEQAVIAGYDEIQHINMLFLNFLAGTEVDTRKQLRFSLIGEQAGTLDLESKEVRQFIKLLADKQIVIDPTVSTFRSLLLKDNLKVDGEFAGIAEHLPPNVVRQIKGAEMDVKPEQKAAYQAGADALLSLVKILYDNKVPLVAGTDNIAGFTLLRELELYSQAGIPNLDVLKIATLDSAKLMGAAHYTGSIDVGKSADVFLVEGNPVKNISDIRNATLVIKGDHYYKPEELYQIIGVTPFISSSKITSL